MTSRLDIAGIASPYQSDISLKDIPENGCPWDRRLADTLARLPGPWIFTTSFGLEDQAITHAISEAELPVTFVTLDTGRLFPETLDLWAETERRYNLRITGFTPDTAETERLVSRQGPLGFRDSVSARQECCRIRKLEPLSRALSGHSVWITGLRAGQSLMRSSTGLMEYDTGFSIAKINPLFDQSRNDVVEFCRLHNVPVSALHAHGYPSIGCYPCTRAIMPEENERAGRWWWEQDGKRECGLHLKPSERHEEKQQES